MAATTSTTHEQHRTSVVVTFTTATSTDIALPDKTIKNISLQSDGVDDGGTLTVLVSNDGTNFVATVVNTSADPRNLTPVTSITAAGAWIFPKELLGFKHLRFTLTGGSGAPVLVLNVVISY